MSILNSLRPSRTVVGAPSESAIPGRGDQAVMRFLTLGGAEVVVVPVQETYYSHAWECLGCDRDDQCLKLYIARDAANEHAGECRAMPKPETAR